MKFVTQTHFRMANSMVVIILRKKIWTRRYNVTTGVGYSFSSHFPQWRHIGCVGVEGGVLGLGGGVGAVVVVGGTTVLLQIPRETGLKTTWFTLFINISKIQYHYYKNYRVTLPGEIYFKTSFKYAYFLYRPDSRYILWTLFGKDRLSNE